MQTGEQAAICWCIGRISWTPFRVSGRAATGGDAAGSHGEKGKKRAELPPTAL